MSTFNKEDLQLILSSSSANTMAQGSTDSDNSLSSALRSGYTTDSYLSHFINWQRHIMIPPKTEDSRLKDLHPFIRPLTPNDLESCVVLENLAYADPRDCASREQLEYRLSKCGEFCLGLFCTVVPGSDFAAETLATSNLVETSRQDRAVSVMLGHVIASKTNDLTATLDSMNVPDDWRSQKTTSTTIGHHDHGRNVVLHSVAVLPDFRSRGIGKTLVKSLMHQIVGAGVSDRLTLLAHEEKLAWYEKRDFKNLGPSAVEFGSGGWCDMVHEIRSPDLGMDR